MESQVNYEELADPDFMRHFDLTMAYQRDADVWAPYLPQAAVWETARQLPIMAKTADAPIVMFRSAPLDRSGRAAFTLELMRHMKIDSYGRYIRTRPLSGPD